MLDDFGITHCIVALYHPETNSKLTNSICQNHLEAVLRILRGLAISDRLKQVLDYLLADIPKIYKANQVKAFRDLSAPLIRWK